LRPKLGKTPFGYKPSTEGSKELEEVPEELEALDKIQTLILNKSISLRDGAAWITFKTGRNISHQGLKNVIRERYSNSEGVST
tara:strand:- start:657 stop:905 length:249 start_codon:yes stop_codon:yes gene_type:complete